MYAYTSSRKEWNLECHFLCHLRLNCDWPVGDGWGNLSTQRKPPYYPMAIKEERGILGMVTFSAI